MDDRDYGDVAVDKQWASKYILGPLYDPEPSQVCATRVLQTLPPSPPASSSPTRPYFQSRHSRSKSQASEDPEDQPFLRRLLSRSNSVNNQSAPTPRSPPSTRPQLLSDLERKRSIHTARPPQTRWNQGTILARANSVASSRPSMDAGMMTAGNDTGRRRGSSLAERYPGDKSHRPLDMLSLEHRAKDGEPAVPRRAGSLRERYPGDMSHRPLAIIKREHRAADRAPHLHTHRRQQPSDTIDSLDHSGPLPDTTYHHGGPFDPAMKSRNFNKMYSPAEAVKDSNLEALKATPAEYIQDSLVKHVPLQGTAVVPPGMKAMNGRTMDYVEGADLMREPDAPGGAYKRWDFVSYQDNDLKGKGEPSYTLDNDGGGRKISRKAVPSSSTGGMAYEMQESATFSSGKNSDTRVRHRSVSNAAEGTRSPPLQSQDPFGDYTANSDLQRRNTTGKSLAQSLKRRLGSLRRKKAPEEKVY